MNGVVPPRCNGTNSCLVHTCADVTAHHAGSPHNCYPDTRPTMPDVTLRDELDAVVIGAKRLRRDVLTLSTALVDREGIALAEAPLRVAHDCLTDVLGILDVLIPQVGAELAKKFADGLPTHEGGNV